MPTVSPFRAGRPSLWLAAFFLAVAGFTPASQAVDPFYTVDSIADLRALTASAQPQVFVAGYYHPRDGGGGFYLWDSSSSSTDNGGTVIVTVPGNQRYRLVQAEPPTVAQFGALPTNSDNYAAIQAALIASSVVRVPPGIYHCSQPISFRSGNALIGIGLSGDTVGVSSVPSPELLFSGSGDACLTSDTTLPLLYPTIENLLIATDPTASYAWVIHFTEPTASIFTNLRISSTSLGTGGIEFNRRLPPNPQGTSYLQHWYNVQVQLPGYTGTLPAPAAMGASIYEDFSDSQIIGGSFSGGTGVHIHGDGGSNFTNVRFSQSVGQNLTLEHDLPAAPLSDGFINCTFESPAVGEVLINLDSYNGDEPDVLPHFVNDVFLSPGITGPLITVQNFTPPAQVVGGLFMNNTFLGNPAIVFQENTYQGAGWTFAHNHYQTVPDFSHTISATVVEDSFVSRPDAISSFASVAGQSGVAVSHHGDLTETALGTVLIPANSLGVNGKLRISATFNAPPTNTGTPTVNIHFGPGSLTTTPPIPLAFQQTLADHGLIHVVCELTMRGNNISAISSGQLGTAGPEVTLGSVLAVNGVNGTQDQSVILSGQNTTVSSDQFTLEQYSVEILRP